MPLKISSRETFFPATALAMYTFSPTGGVIAAISLNFRTTTPNQIGSYPREIMMGMKIGRVRA
ncbi:MAG: hypothetical protein PWP47_1134 [Synergistaceae bacterium]|nr:hypothetical protein [Synergistaceae bacterium]